jgi:phosphate transport system protein
VLRDRVLVLGGEAEAALGRAMYALTERDSDAARGVIERDDEIDLMYGQLFHDMIELMASEPATTPRAARLLFVAEHLERVADYVTDICELTVYMAEAAVIKHSY